MGLLLSTFRRKRTTVQVLEDLEKKINTIEQYGYNTELRRRRVVGVLMVFSVGLYGLSMLFFYFYFRLTNWKEILIYSTPLLVFPFLVIFIRYILTYYYEWKLDRNKAKLIDMRAEKKRILEEVMDKETYKHAKEILDKFGESKDLLPASQPIKQVTPIKSVMPHLNTTPVQLRQRQLASGNKNMSIPNQNLSLMSTPGRIGFESLAVQNRMSLPPSAQLPRPILTSGGPFDRLVDYLVGDGPGSRYALICAKCAGHNGMALPEEFEYLSYRCAYCNFTNAARKQKPKAPPLISTPVHLRSSPPDVHKTDESGSEEEKNSSKDSDEDAIPSPIKVIEADTKCNHEDIHEDTKED